jgi:hypothetical protein
MLLQFGLSGVTRPTARRPARELLISPRRRASAEADP